MLILSKIKGFEDINHKQKCFETMSAAIIKKSPVSFEYKDKQRIVNPYKLINNDGIWYLLADENSKLKNIYIL